MITEGWFDKAFHYAIKPRPDANEVLFTPVYRGMHPLIQQLYGAPRGCVVHCTDVVCDARALAKRTATVSPRKSAYTLLIGKDGDLHQLCSIFDRPWHAGRGKVSKKYQQVQPFMGVNGTLYHDGWRWPKVDGRVVIDPNQWGPGIEIMGKPGMPTGPQLDTLKAVLLNLFKHTKITPDTVWRHGDLDPLNRSDPGFDVAAFIASFDAESARENDGWDGGSEPDDPFSGPAPHG